MRTWDARDPDYYPDPECTDCDVKQAHLDDIKEYMELIVTALYDDKPIPEFFEHWLEEAINLVGLKLPSKTLKIKK